MQGRRCRKTDFHRIEIINYIAVFADIVILIIIQHLFLRHLLIQNITSVRFVNDN